MTKSPQFLGWRKNLQINQRFRRERQNKSWCRSKSQNISQSKNGSTKYRVILGLLSFLSLSLLPPLPSNLAQAETCPDLKVVFARGSGAERDNNADYQAFRKAISYWLDETPLNYEITDLDYAAIGVNSPLTLIGAYVGAGETYQFGESVKEGANNLITYTNTYCPNSKIVMAGYSQGALVLMKALPKLNQDKIIYLATFGDPKIYLPEGQGLLPAACRGQNLSDYRMYVPDCRVYEGLLGSVRPYEPENMQGKVGTWCNKYDIFCSTHFSITDHTAYESSGLYEDAAKVIYTKVTAAFNLTPKITAHDTAILIDSTGSMSSLIQKYKAEALRLAKETLNNGGRVALYDYGDLAEGYQPVKHCDFDTCTLDLVQKGLDEIRPFGGGDAFESALSASLKVMKELNWRLGSTKSLVILTDDGFLNPDRDGVSYFEVVKLSKEIDPVNFYIITKTDKVPLYEDLAFDTDGRVVNIDSDEHLELTDQILARVDSLPRVEEDTTDVLTPTLKITEVLTGSASSDAPEFFTLNNDASTNFVTVVNNASTVRFETTGERTLVILGEQVLGVVEGNEITVTGITEPTELTLVPLSLDTRGERAVVTLSPAVSNSDSLQLLGEETAAIRESEPSSSEPQQEAENSAAVVPKAPRTGAK